MSNITKYSITLFLMLQSLNLINTIPTELIVNGHNSNNNNSKEVFTLKKDNPKITSEQNVIKAFTQNLNNLTAFAFTSNQDTPVAAALVSERPNQHDKIEKHTKQSTQQKESLPFKKKETFFKAHGKKDDAGYEKSFYKKGKGGYDNFEVFHKKDNGEYEHTKQNSNSKGSLRKKFKGPNDDERESKNEEEETIENKAHATSKIIIPTDQNNNKAEDSYSEETKNTERPKFKRHDQQYDLNRSRSTYQVHENIDEGKKFANGGNRLTQAPHQARLISGVVSTSSNPPQRPLPFSSNLLQSPLPFSSNPLQSPLPFSSNPPQRPLPFSSNPPQGSTPFLSNRPQRPLPFSSNPSLGSTPFSSNFPQGSTPFLSNPSQRPLPQISSENDLLRTGTYGTRNRGGYQAFVVHDPVTDYTAVDSNNKNYDDAEKSDTKSTLTKQDAPFFNYDYPVLNVNYNDQNLPNYDKPITALRDKIRVDYGDDLSRTLNFDDKYDGIDYEGNYETLKQKQTPYYENTDEDITKKEKKRENKAKGDDKKEIKNKVTKPQVFAANDYSSYENDDEDGEGKAQNAEYDEYDGEKDEDDEEEGQHHAAENVKDGDYDEYDGEVVEHAAEEGQGEGDSEEDEGY